MRTWDESIELIAISSEGDQIQRMILANKLPVSRSEFYQAAAAGLMPDIRFEIWSFEFEGETLFRHDGVLYHILRTYQAETDLIEIVGAAMNMPNTVKVIRKDPDPANMDPFGNRPTIGESIYECRMDETSKVVKNQQGDEVVSTTQFTLPGWYKVSYIDELQWTDSFGIEVTKSPIAMEFIRDRAGAIQFLVVSC